MTNMEEDVKTKEQFLNDFLINNIASMCDKIKIRGLGLIWGIDIANLGNENLAQKIISRCFQLGLIVEKVGRHDNVIKILPPLTIEQSLLEKGCSIIQQAFEECLA
jgi:diaminobutyrate-2-oxoglutarate transaminase